MVRARRHAALIVICLGAGLLIWLGAGRLINSIRAADAQEPPALMVEAQFPGMPASVVEERVAATLEMKINGIENVGRFRSRCGRDGSYSLEITFERGTDPNRGADARPESGERRHAPAARGSPTARGHRQESVAVPGLAAHRLIDRRKCRYLRSQ